MSLPRKTMKRRERPGWRFLTFSCRHRLPLLESNTAKAIFLTCLTECRQRDSFELAAWVIMPEHVHLLLRPNLPEWPVSKILWHVKRASARQIVAYWHAHRSSMLTLITDTEGRSQFWQPGGGYDRNIFTADEFDEKLTYIHLNPVRRGLVEQPHQWQWSSHMAAALKLDPLTPREVVEVAWAEQKVREDQWRERVMKAAQQHNERGV